MLACIHISFAYRSDLHVHTEHMSPDSGYLGNSTVQDSRRSELDIPILMVAYENACFSA